MRKKTYLIICLMVALTWIVLFSAKALADDAQLVPKRLSSIGDSITVGMNAELFFENHYASWVNGHHGFWQWLFGLTNVNSHNQRITAKYGRWGRRNYMFAESGADSYDFVAQAQKAVQKYSTYVTVLLGNNDVCSDDLPMDPDVFKENMAVGLAVLEDGLPHGATVYVIGIPDISQLWDAIQDKKALGIVDCQVLWILNPFDLFPSICMGLLSKYPGVMNWYISQYNSRLYDLVNELNDTDSPHYYYYTDAAFLNGINENEVSDIDCYHPSAYGQSVLSDITWNAEDGPQF